MRTSLYLVVTNVLKSILLKYASVVQADVWGWWGFFELFCIQQLTFFKVCSMKCSYWCTSTRCMLFLVNGFSFVNVNYCCITVGGSNLITAYVFFFFSPDYRLILAIKKVC